MKKAVFITLLTLISIPFMAQKTYTLDEIIPGGTGYYSLRPESRFYAWWGEKLVQLETECVKLVQLPSAKKAVKSVDSASEVLFTLDGLNKIAEASDIRDLVSCLNMTFPEADKPIVQAVLRDVIVRINWQSGEIVWTVSNDHAKYASADMASSRALAYRYKDNLYVQTADGAVNQLTTDGSSDIVYGTSVHRDEFGISKGTFWSEDGTKLAFYRMDQSMVSKYPQVNITPFEHTQVSSAKEWEEGDSRCATYEPDAYPMAGETSHKVTVGIYDVATQKTVYLQTGDPTDRYFTNISWSPDGKKLYLIEVNRDQNHGTLDEYDAETGVKIRTLLTEHNDRYFEPTSPIQFLPWDSKRFVYMTRRDGYRHIYLYRLPKGGGEAVLERQLTKGEYEVFDLLGFCPSQKTIIYASNEQMPLQTNVYSVTMAGVRTVLGNADGVHDDVTLSASGKQYFERYSAAVEAKTGKPVLRRYDCVSTKTGLAQTLFEADDPVSKYWHPEVRVGTLKAADGKTDLYYRMVLPKDFDPSKKYPAIVYVYGGPHAHMIESTYNYGARAWDVYMAQEGYVMFTLDNRGSEHRGLEFEQATFRQLGVVEMQDQLCGVDYLKSLPFVDANRLGVHGWSFGGFMTSSLMCSFTGTDEPAPGLFQGESPFKVGVAGGPVIDWRFYEVMYGERYMDTPQQNPEGYDSTSLLPKAKNLRGRLMVIYGHNDPTCVPQHTLSFIRACIDAGTYPDLFTYPGDGHNMYGTDRVHLHGVITRYFKEHL